MRPCDLGRVRQIGHVRLRFAPPPSSGEQRHREQLGSHPADPRVSIGARRGVQRDVGAQLQGVLALLQHHVFSISAQRTRHAPALWKNQYVCYGMTVSIILATLFHCRFYKNK
jgi:hypothetical protein